ncbi:hypothetical protein GGI03_003312 [Coemansia sp. RSA 2337]|nr:hypothetical protein GGI03_003312 [Coemansia sp. RSA 2337]
MRRVAMVNYYNSRWDVLRNETMVVTAPIRNIGSASGNSVNGLVDGFFVLDRATYGGEIKQFNIRLFNDPSSGSGGSWTSWPHDLELVSRPSLSFATTLSIVADTRLVYSGDALKMILNSPLRTALFPKVRSLICSFIWLPPDWNYYDPEDVEANICAFVERVKQVVPMVNKVSIRSNEADNMGQLSEDEYFGYLTSHLYQLASRISYTADAPFNPMELQLGLIHNLTSLECESNIDSISNIVQVARQSAQTLQKLTLAYQLQIDIADLVQNPGGDYVEYPCLSTLFLDLNTYPSFPPLSVDSGVVLFPGLKSINVSYDYPFGDDALFRGNTATLEYLRVAPGPEFCNVVRRYKVFTPTSHPKLQWVESVRLPIGMETQFASTESHLRFMLNIAPDAAVKVIDDIPVGEETFLALNQLSDHTFMQVLNLGSTQLMLWEVIHIVKSLPILSDLVCQSTGLGTYFEDIAVDMLPVYVRGIQVPLRERFRCWRLGDVNSSSLKETVMCILVVAMTFPNFSYANLPNSILHEYMELMKETLELDEYVEVAPRLRRLLFDKTV